MLSVYHASARSNKESPVLNRPPRLVSFAGYNWLIVVKTSCVTVEGSMSNSLMNVSNLASSSLGAVLRLRTDWLNMVPSLS